MLKILIVDQDKNRISALEDCFYNNKDLSVSIVEDVKEAIKFRPDLVFISFEIYVKEKKFLEKFIKENLCIFLVSFKDVLQISELILKGFKYLIYPFKKEEVLKIIEKVIEERKSVIPTVPLKEETKIAEEIKIEEREKVRIETLKDLLSVELYPRFQKFLKEKLSLDEQKYIQIKNLPFEKIYSLKEILAIPSAFLAQYISEFLKIKYLSYIDNENVMFTNLSKNFCEKHYVLEINQEGESVILFSNPFDYPLLEILYSMGLKDKKVAVTEFENIENFFKPQQIAEYVSTSEEIEEVEDKEGNISDYLLKKEAESLPTVSLLRRIIYKAVHQRATDIHIEPKEKETIIRYRIDGDLAQVGTLTLDTTKKLVARIKILSKLDISEKRRPQDGSFSVVVSGKNMNFRVATTPTPYGEGVVIRILKPEEKVKELQELGMTDEQAKIMEDLIKYQAGFIVIVGVTGSGKTTTCYSLLNKIDGRKRSILTVEDPVEYTLPYATQQQVNEKIGLTFEVLLRSAMRQDPNILFIGEIRDPYSANVAVTMASTGHLTIGTLHSANATTAIWRLEMLGVNRDKIAESVLAVVAQKLLKVLCPKCKRVRDIGEEEKKILLDFTDKVPNYVYEPVGCPYCSYTGFYGRKGVYEILVFDKEVKNMIRNNEPIYQIRDFIKSHGGVLLKDVAILRLKEGLFSFEQVYSQVLSEELYLKEEIVKPSDKKSILIVDDDNFTRKLLTQLLTKQGYDITSVGDGVEALLTIGKMKFDLIVSDITMPNLDGIKLLELLKQKGVETPVLFLTGQESTELEASAKALGACGYIRKPITENTIKQIIDFIDKKDESKNCFEQ